MITNAQLAILIMESIGMLTVDKKILPLYTSAVVFTIIIFFFLP